MRGEVFVIVLGIDPGYAITGYGVIESRNGRLRPLAYGALRTSAATMFPDRLKAIHQGLSDLIERHSPQAVAVEELFFARNTTTALGTAQARGVAVLAAAEADLPVFEYTPAQVKLAVTGYGKADKVQIQDMVRIMLGFKERPRPDDAADALAIAICHAHTGNLRDNAAIGGHTR